MNYVFFSDAFFPGFWERSVNDNWTLFKTKVKSLTNKYIPLVRVLSKRSPWFNNSLQRMLNKENRIFRKCKNSKSPGRWSAYQSVATEYRLALATVKRTFFHNTLPSLLSTDPSKFWRVFKKSTGSDICLKTDAGSLVPRNECCAHLNDTFSLSFTDTSSTTLPCFRNFLHPRMDSIIIDWEGIAKLINNAKVSSSAGINGITTRF